MSQKRWRNVNRKIPVIDIAKRPRIRMATLNRLFKKFSREEIKQLVHNLDNYFLQTVDGKVQPSNAWQLGPYHLIMCRNETEYYIREKWMRDYPDQKLLPVNRRPEVNTIYKLLSCPVQELPLYINEKDYASIATWRIKLNK